MNTEQRYSVPLTLREMEALMNSHNHCISTRVDYSSAQEQIEDVYWTCKHITEREPLYHLTSNTVRRDRPNRTVRLWAGKGTDIFDAFRMYQALTFDVNAPFPETQYGIACDLSIPDNSTSVKD